MKGVARNITPVYHNKPSQEPLQVQYQRREVVKHSYITYKRTMPMNATEAQPAKRRLEDILLHMSINER